MSTTGTTFWVALAIIGAAFHCQARNEKLGWLVPNPDGSPYWMSRETFETEFKAYTASYPVVKFYLHTKLNPTTRQEIILNEEQSLRNSHFNSRDGTVVIIHGWRNNYGSTLNGLIREAYLKKGHQNIIHVDWSSDASSVYYPNSRYAVPQVGRVVGHFLDFLVTSGHIPMGSITLVGHSLGAHVAGFAAKNARTGEVKVIIGLDPAYPLFSYSDCSSRLCESDARLVQTIQTSGGYLGFLEPIGDAAFYPNGGISQPVCRFDPVGSCAHSMAYVYYAEAVEKNDFNSVRCKDYHAAVDNACGDVYSGEKMGRPQHFGVSGVFYVPVNDYPPYGRN